MAYTKELLDALKQNKEWYDRVHAVREAIADEDKRPGALFELAADGAKKILSKIGLSAIEDNPYELVFSSYFEMAKALVNQLAAQGKFEEEWGNQLKASREIGPKTEAFLKDFRPQGATGNVTNYIKMLQNNTSAALNLQALAATYEVSSEAGEGNLLGVFFSGWALTRSNKDYMSQLLQAEVRAAQLVSGYDKFLDRFNKSSGATPGYAFFTQIRNRMNEDTIQMDDAESPHGIRNSFYDAQVSIEKVIDLWVDKLQQAANIMQKYFDEIARLRSSR
jgi:hypothetical protein